MNIQNKLYMFHIPLTKVRFVNQIVRLYIKPAYLPAYPSIAKETNTNLNDFAYMHGHFGNYPLSNVTDLSTACLFRDPLERAVTNFAFIYNRILQDKYSNIEGMKNKLVEYLLNDQDYTFHNNIHARFLLSGTDHEIQHIANPPFEKHWQDPTLSIEEKNVIESEYILRSKNWYFPETEISLNSAKNVIDNIDIIGTSDDIDSFIDSVLGWFDQNYGINHDVHPNLLIDATDPQVIDSDGNNVKVEDLLLLLSESEINQYKENNQIDYGIYEYVKSKLV